MREVGEGALLHLLAPLFPPTCRPHLPLSPIPPSPACPPIPTHPPPVQLLEGFRSTVGAMQLGTGLVVDWAVGAVVQDGPLLEVGGLGRGCRVLVLVYVFYLMFVLFVRVCF